VKRSFSAVLYSPGGDIPSEEKIAIAREYGYRNDHERDALAAAASAFKKYKNKFQQVEKKCPPDLDPEEVKALVVRGLSIDQAISGMTPPPPAEEPAPEREVEAKIDSQMAAFIAENRRQADQIRRQKEYLEELKVQLAAGEEGRRKLEEKIERLKDRSRREIKRDLEIRIREKEIERLRGILRQERKMNRRLKSRLKRERRAEELEEKAVGRPVKEVASFSKEALVEASSRLDIARGDVIFLKDATGGGPSAADLLIAMEVEAVIAGTDMDAKVEGLLMDGGVPVLSRRQVPVRLVAGVGLIDPRDLEEAVSGWADRRRTRVAKQKAEWLEGMIRDYRAERRKDEQQRRKAAEG